MSELKALQEWYAQMSDGDWEHEFGITIETLDNPGWIVKGSPWRQIRATHLHVDYFSEHDYLAEGSGSLVVAIDSDAI